MFSGTGIQTIENLNAPNTYPALFSGVIGRIVIEKPLGSGDMILKGTVSLCENFKFLQTTMLQLMLQTRP